MKALLVLALLASNAGAIDYVGGGGSDCTTNCTFTSVTTNGTAPSLTATGASFRDSITVKAGSATLVSTEAGPTNSNLLGAALLVGGDSTLSESVGIRTRNFTGISGSGFVGQLASKGNSAMEVFTIGAAPLVFGTNSLEAFRLSAANIPTFIEGSAIAGSVTHTSTMTMRCGAGTTRCPIGWATSGYAVPSGVGNSNGDKLNFYDASAGAGEKYVIGLEPGYMWFQSAGGGGGAGDGFKWYTGATESMTMKAGNVGIGTASPNAKLDVTGSAMFGTGGTQSTFTATGFFQPYSRTTLQLSLLAPSAVGQYIDNSTIGALCRSTGTAAGNWSLATATATGCF